ncbi:MAG: aldo/keto reductase [Candidatus Binataceae bacterium]
MEPRTLGKTGLGVSVLGFGGSETGYGGASVKAVEKILSGAIDAGLNFIDTAECYGDGESLIGRAIAHRRAEFHLATKCGHADGLGGRDWQPATLDKSIDRSLTRLRTDRVDLLQLHSCSADTLQRGALIDVLERARTAGKTRFIGYSGDGEDALYAIKSGRFDTLQISVSIADQRAIDLVIPEAARQRLGVIAKRPIANAAWIGHDGYSRPYYDRLRILGYDFLASDDAVGVALRFTLSVPGVHTAIVGTTKPGRFERNAASLAAGPLPKAHYERIRARWRDVAKPTWVGQM